jgi:hypothetical protein
MSDRGFTDDERAGMRAFLQRSEVRLSTIHRTATALLSGAGVLVLLPALGRDAIVTVLQALLGSTDSRMHLILAGLVIAVLGLALVVIWLLLVEVTRFFFHPNHIMSSHGATFTPRFTLNSLHLPSDELSVDSHSELVRSRNHQASIEVLVSPNEKARQQIDQQVAAYEGLDNGLVPTDESRSAALLALAGVKDRSLAEEVAKVEYGMARHVLRIQVIVLRYLKALLVVILTTLIAFLFAAVVEHSPNVDISAQRWIVGTLLLWCPAVLFVSSSPVRWLDQLLRSEGAVGGAIRFDKELTRVERVTARFSISVLVVSLGCAVSLVGKSASTLGASAFMAAIAISVICETALVVQARRH